MLKETWDKVPENAYVFPNYLFRPLSYPLTYGTFIGDVPKYIIHRYGSIEKSIEEKKVPYLLVSDYILGFMDPYSQKYVRENYHVRSDGLYVRN